MDTKIKTYIPMKKNANETTNYLSKSTVNKKEVREAIAKAQRENKKVDESTKIDYYALSTRAGS